MATVSRALNGSPAVTRGTRTRIERTATRLRYVPLGAARSLVTRRTQTIGALLPTLYGGFYSELIRGIDLAARARGLHLLVSSSHGNVDEAAVALRAMQGRVDGVLILSPLAEPGFLRRHLADALPAVLLESAVRQRRCPRVNVDDFGGARAMTEHLLGCGHRKFAFIAGPHPRHDADERRRGFEAALAGRRGVRARLLEGDYSEASGYLAGRALVRARQRPDAVFAATDRMAIGCLSAFNEAGLGVPGDIALAGFDDIPMARYAQPPLTTVRVRIAELGHAALERLAAQMASPAASIAELTTVPCELIVRESCGSRAAGSRPAARASD